MNSNLPEKDDFNCSLPALNIAPLALLVVGTADTVVPFTGWEVQFMGKSRGAVLSADATVDLLRKAIGTELTSPTETALSDYSLNDGVNSGKKIWRADDNREVRLLTLHGVGHMLAHPEYFTMPSFAGKFSRDFSEAEYI